MPDLPVSWKIHFASNVKSVVDGREGGQISDFFSVKASCYHNIYWWLEGRKCKNLFFSEISQERNGFLRRLP